MSMSLYVYVGPFLKCYPRGACDVYELTKDALCDLIGEGDRQEFDALGPSNHVDGLRRVLAWGKDGELPTVELNALVERDAFATAFANEIAILHTKYERVELTWGVVPGWF